MHGGDAQATLLADVCCLAGLLWGWAPARSPPPASPLGLSYPLGYHQKEWAWQRRSRRANFTWITCWHLPRDQVIHVKTIEIMSEVVSSFKKHRNFICPWLNHMFWMLFCLPNGCNLSAFSFLLPDQHKAFSNPLPMLYLVSYCWQASLC